MRIRSTLLRLPMFACLLILPSCGGKGSSSGTSISQNPPSTATAPTISTAGQPQDQTATVGQTATFTVTSTGTAPLTYQWRKDGEVINGAISASYTTPATTLDDSGSSFTVTVSNTAGNVLSNAATLTVNPATDATAPSVPANLTATTASSNQINLAWTASTDNVAVTGYRIYRGGTQIMTVATTSYSDTGLAASTTYAYTVAAFDSAGNVSARCSAISATTQSGVVLDVTAPSTPTNLSATGASTTQINLTWTASTDNVAVMGYHIFRGGAEIGTSTTTHFMDSGRTAATTYSYTVSANDAAGNISPQCAAVNGATLAVGQGMQARHYDGQTILTWNETADVVAATPASMTMDELRTLRTNLENTSYRIYRSTAPITSVVGLTPIKTVGVLSGWNSEFYGPENATGQTFRFVVDRETHDIASTPVGIGTAICAYNPPNSGTAYYVVTTIQNGAEDTTIGTNNTASITETVGQGVPILQRVETEQDYHYTSGTSTHYYYTRWECPPHSNIQGRPIDYKVIVPEAYDPTTPMPAMVSFHGWGGNLLGMSWWFNYEVGTIVITSNEEPYDWWTGYHELRSIGTFSQQAWQAGVVRPYTQNRINSFFDWVASKWNIDRSRTIQSGISMGGSGSIMYGIRNPNRIAWVNSWVGVHIPAESPTFLSSYQNSYGELGWSILYEDGVTPAFTYFDDNWYLRNHISDETPYIMFSNGKNDAAIGWGQAVHFVQALQETRRPYIFDWGQSGHGQRALCPPDLDGYRSQYDNPIDIRTDQTLPAFTQCSLDQNPGNGDPADGDSEGQMNAFLYWRTDDIVDETLQWEMTCGIVQTAPSATCTVSLTPRRLQHFLVSPNARFQWTNTSLLTNTVVQSGTVAADAHGLITIQGLQLGQITRSGGGNRIRVIPVV